MKFVIQTNIFAEENFNNLLDAVDRLGLARCLVKCIPFGGGMEIVDGRLPLPSERAIVLGSYTLCRVAQERGWTPGAFLDGLDFLMQRNFWGDRMLNHDASVCRLFEVPREAYRRYIGGPFFLRPYHDSKSFNGGVFDHATFDDFLWGIFNLRNSKFEYPPGAQVTDKTLVCMSSLKKITSETRCWVVYDKKTHTPKVVTSSGYKRGTLKYYTPPEAVEPRIIEFAEGLALGWRPNDAFVMDVAEDEDGHLRVVEANCLNSAGWYKADMNRLVQALADL